MIAEPWYRNAIFYSLAVETFQDSDGDGVGDIPGLTARLDYLEALGVDVVWLAPCYPSPNRDDGYDITDYYGIDPRLGTSGDFAELLREAEGRGIRVIVDLVVNHTSDQHPWFKAPERHDWYVWSDKKPRNFRSGIVFPGVQDSVWSYRRDVRQWYFHRFYDFQPDLNMENPEVRAELLRIVGYWLKLGVAGFRVDAVPFMLEKARPNRKPILRFEHLHELREELEWRSSEAVLLGEANVVPRDDAEYFSDGRGLHMMFNFWVNQHLFAGLATGDARPLRAALQQTRAIPKRAQWANFLRNHDELDLGRLDPAVRRRVFAELAPDESMQLYGRGIRRRLAPMLGDRARIELAYSLMLALPGAPTLRYGEEIGMGENLRLKERNAIRTPMQWSADANAGFSTSSELVRPVIDKGPYRYTDVNVEQQLRDSSSLLRTVSELVRVRKLCPEIGAGDWEPIATRKPSVLALRYGDVVTAHNLGAAPVEVNLGASLRDLLRRGGDSRSGRVRLEPHGYGWWRRGE